MPFDSIAAARRRSSNESNIRNAATKRASAHARGTTGQTSPERRARNVQPLRRGDACLMCRAKKLKCSATKPSCDQCTKRSDRCVYDAVRPASRVEKLEKKLAEMEAADMHAGAARRHSHSAVASPPINGHLSRTPEHAPLFEYSAMPFSSSVPHRSTAQAGPSRASSLDSMHPETHHNNNSWSWSSTGHSSFQQSESATSAPTYTNLPWNLLSSTNQVSPAAGFWPPTVTPVTDAANTDTRALSSSMALMDSCQMLAPNYAPPPTLSSTTLQPSQHSSPYPSVHDFKTQSQLGAGANGHVSNGNTTANGHLTGSDSNGTPLLQSSPLSYPHLNLDPSFAPQGQLEEKDISQAAREYLLDLYFSPLGPSRTTVAGGWVERERLATRLASEEPHPCLLFALYTVAASTSYIPAVQALDTSLYNITTKKLDEAIAEEQGLADATVTCAILGEWLTSRSQTLDGHQLISRGASLALACGLHVPRAANVHARFLGWIGDQGAVTDCIYAFWTIWSVERTMALVTSLPTTIRDEEVCAPFPKPRGQEHNTTDAREHFDTLRDFYSSNSARLSLRSARLVALHLVHRARTLRNSPREGVSLYTPPQDQTQLPIRGEYPTAFVQIHKAVDKVEKSLPEGLTTDILVIKAYLHATRLFLVDPDLDRPDQDATVHTSQNLFNFLREWHDQPPETEQVVDNACAKKGLPLGAFMPFVIACERSCKAARTFCRNGYHPEAGHTLVMAKDGLELLRSLNAPHTIQLQLDRLAKVIEALQRSERTLHGP